MPSAAPGALRATDSGGIPGAVSCNPAASTAVPINARRGSSRCVTNRPLGRTSIQCRSSASPVAATRALCSGMPRQDLTG
jgi:hypothetical protein